MYDYGINNPNILDLLIVHKILELLKYTGGKRDKHFICRR